MSADPASAQMPSGSPRLICFGNEPNWSVAFTAADQARVTAPNAPPAEYRGRETRLEHLRESVWRGHWNGGTGDLVLLKREASCSDGMSDKTHPFVARLSLADGTVLAGCCRVPAPEAEDGSVLEGPTWLLTSLPGRRPADLKALHRPVRLRLTEGRVTGFGGCNLLTGSYATKGSSVTLNLASTMMACPEPGMGIERAFLEALKGPVSHAVKGDHLTLTTGAGAALEFTREPEQTLTGHTWNVTQFNNGRQATISLLADSKITMTFANGKVSGKAGCNTFNATYSTQGDNAVTIGPAVTTRMMCADAVMTQERQFLTALQSATKWAIEGGELDMHRADGERALSAHPTK
jgi:heat shock protein HslJ